jgi:hypothetical protein
MKELLKQDSKLQLARCERLVEKRVEVAVFRRPWARCSERNGKIKMNGGVEALSVLAGIYSSPTLERNLQWSSSDEAEFMANRESIFNFWSRILRFVCRQTLPGGWRPMERLKSFPPTVSFPVSISFTGRALRYLRIG